MQPYPVRNVYRHGAAITERNIGYPDLRNQSLPDDTNMSFSESAICLRCNISLIPDYERQEWYCSKCGFTQSLDIEEPDNGQRPAGLPRPHPLLLGSSKLDLWQAKDYQSKPINGQLRGNLKIAAKRDKQRPEREEAAVEHIVNLYDSFVYQTYDDGLKKADLEILKQHAKNLVAATGPKQDKLHLMEVIRYFLRKKLERYPELKIFFKLGLLRIKIRYTREKPQNISGRGNQLGKKRKEGCIEHCNVCDRPIENYGAREHHDKHHPEIPYHQYISRKNKYVSRAAMVVGVTIECSAAQDYDGKKSVERGPCTRCNVVDAIIKRYRVRVSKKDRVDIVSRIAARHKDSRGKWKVCVLEQHKRSQL